MSDDHDDVADACLRAAEQVMTHGSPELKAAMRVVLLILGQEIARDLEGPVPNEDKTREP